MNEKAKVVGFIGSRAGAQARDEVVLGIISDIVALQVKLGSTVGPDISQHLGGMQRAARGLLTGRLSDTAPPDGSIAAGYRRDLQQMLQGINDLLTEMMTSQQFPPDGDLRQIGTACRLASERILNYLTVAVIEGELAVRQRVGQI